MSATLGTGPVGPTVDDGRGPDGFDAATAVTPAAGPGVRTTQAGAAPAGQALYDAMLSSTWAIGERPHGGYLLGILARAASLAVRAAGPADHAHPLTTSAIYLRSPNFGPAQVAVEVLRTGRSVSHAQVTLLQDGQPCVRALHVFGPLDPTAVPRVLGERPPALPPVDECPPLPRPPAMPDGTVIRIGIRDIIDLRIDPTSLPAGTPGTASTGSGSEEAELRAWLTFKDGRPADPLSLLFTLDALPPVTFALGSAGWVPTLELTAYIRALPAPGPLRVRQRGRLLQNGRIDEICDVWDSAGRLVAQASQLAAVRLPG